MKHVSRKIIALLLAVAMILSVLPTAFAGNVGPFTDVSSNAWYAEYVAYVYDNGLMNGVTTTTFAPEHTMTRAQAATVLYRIAGEPEVSASCDFVDLTASWYKNAVIWAAQNGIVNGVTATRFAPDAEVTREQIVTMLWRYAGKEKVETDEISAFSDADKVSAYAVDAFNWAIANGIINGKGGRLVPQGNAKRCEVAKILCCFLQLPRECKHDWDEDGVCKLCGKKGKIVVYYTNDVHSYIDKALSYDQIADLKLKAAEENVGALLVDAGDHIQGTAYGSMDNGKTIIELMNAAGYDLATLGNHEFDYGMDGCMNAISWADYPYVSCNFYRESAGVRGENVLDSYQVFEIGGVKLAIIGITTPESFTKSTPKYFQDAEGNYIYGIAGGADGSALYADVQKAIDAASQEADIVIALGHLGDDPASDPWNSEDVIAHTTGLDAFIDGHSHSTVESREVKDQGGNTVILTQTGNYFDAIGQMTIDVRDLSIRTELITAHDGSVEEVKAIKDAWMTEVDTKLNQKIAESDINFTITYENGKRAIRSSETNMGDLNADAYYWFVNENLDGGCDMAVMNGGGIRSKADAGDWTYKTCKTINTFGNVLCCIELSGQQILDALEFGARFTTGNPEDLKENGGFLQVAGCTYEIDTSIANTITVDDKNVWQAGPEAYRVSNVKIYDKTTGTYEALDLTKTYRVAGSNYTLYDCGDGFNMFVGGKHILDGISMDYLAMAAYVAAFKDTDGNGFGNIASANSPLAALPGYMLNYESATGAGRITIKVAEPEPTEPSEEPTEPSEEPTEPSEEPVEGQDYVLSTSVKTGDQVVIWHVNSGMALSDEDYPDNADYRAGVAVTPVEDVITTDNTHIVWNVTEVDGGITLTNAAGQKLSIGSKGLKLDSEHDVWEVLAAQTENCVYLKSTTATGTSGDPKAVEYFRGDFTTYYLGANANEADFALKLFVLGAEPTEPTEPSEEPTEPSEEPTEPSEEPTEPSEESTEPSEESTEPSEESTEPTEESTEPTEESTEPSDEPTEPSEEPAEEFVFTLADELNDGDFVVVYHVASGMALTDIPTGTNLEGTAVTPVDAEVITDNLDIIWTVTATENGITLTSISGDVLSIGSKGLNLNGDHTEWTVEPAATEGTYYMVSTTAAGSSGDPKAVEYYNGAFTTFYLNASSTDALFALQFYVMPAGEETPCFLIYNDANQAVVGFFEDEDGSGVTTQAASMQDGALVTPYSNAGTFYAIQNEDGTWSFVDEYSYIWDDQTFLLGVNAEGKSCYTEEWDAYACFRLIPVEGGYLMQNQGSETYLAIQDNYVVAAELVEGDQDFVFKFAAVVEYIEDEEAGYSIIADILDGLPGVDEPEVPLDPTEPSEEPTEPSEEPSEPAEGKWVIAESVEVGDTIAVVVEHEGILYALTDEVNSNALVAATVSVTDGELNLGVASAVWTIGEGNTLSTDMGAIAWGGSGTGLSIGTEGTSFRFTCGEGTSELFLTATESAGTQRALFFRLPSTGIPQFRAYALSNTASDYSRVITIWKLA